MHGAAHAPPEADRETRWASVGCLELRDFRNFRGLRCDFPATGVAIVGPNGSGKTNLLEAIYYLQIFRSFRGAADSELVRFGGEVFRISGEVKGTGDRRELTAAYGRAERRKKVTIDGAEVGRLVEAIGALGAVVFSPDDAEIVRGSPARRRRFLDIVLSLMEPGYVSSLQRFRAVLAQRNEALRSQAARSVVEAWTDGLVEWGSRVMASRARWVARQRERYRGYHATISGGGRGEPIYEPGLGRRPPDRGGEDAGADAAEVREGELRESTEGWGERLRRALDGAAERERQRGVTLCGPHRDDLMLRAAEDDRSRPRDLRVYGSGGQQRTAAIALRLVEADSLRDRTGREPVYLLDDVFAELDPQRSERVVRLLDEGRTGQVILTAPKATDIPLRGGDLEEWRIRNGEIAG